MTKDSPSILVVTGESSGEQHLAGVMRAFQKSFPERPVRWVGSGGPRMAAAGAELLLDVSSLAAIGPRAALSHSRSYLQLYRALVREALARRPTLALLVDFPEFNLRLAHRLSGMGIPICYFIAPQVWAWRSSRVKTIRRCVDRLLVILPFEVEFFRSRGVNARYVGHPLVQLRRSGDSGIPVLREDGVRRVVLMPGSRRGEVESILPVQLDAAGRLMQKLDCRFWLLRAPAIEADLLQSGLRRWREDGGVELPLEIRDEPSSELLPQAHCAIIKSGTSTLEAMILGVPFVMVYRMSPLSYRMLKPWVRTQTYCLANLVAGKSVVPEFVQEEARGEAVAECLADLLRDPEKMDGMKQNLRIASETLGHLDAYAETAKELARFF